MGNKCASSVSDPRGDDRPEVSRVEEHECWMATSTRFVSDEVCFEVIMKDAMRDPMLRIGGNSDVQAYIQRLKRRAPARPTRPGGSLRIREMTTGRTPCTSATGSIETHAMARTRVRRQMVVSEAYAADAMRRASDTYSRAGSHTGGVE